MEDFRPAEFNIKLQLFAEKTEKPTAKRREKAVQKGQLPQSAEVNSVLVLLISFLIIKYLFPGLIKEWTGLMDNLFKTFERENFNIDYRTLQEMFILTLISSVKILGPIIGGVMIGGLAASYFQIGFHITPLNASFNNIDPVQGFKRLFSWHSTAELIKSLLKVLIVGYVIYIEYTREFSNFSRLADMSLLASSAYIGEVSLKIVFKVILWMIVLAVADLLFQRWRNEKQLMMSKEEIKEEHKQQEGDPQLKGKMKQIQRQMAMNRMMQVLPKADVVITNPTHLAVALKYDSAEMNAPVVIAKGQDRLALKIKEVAGENNIPVIENKPLARSLYFGAEIGDAIPPELYQAVAEILAFVYKLKGKI